MFKTKLIFESGMRILMKNSSSPANRQAIVFYDGECLFCSYWVRFIIKHNPAQNLYFATLRSATSLDFPSDVKIKGDIGNSILLLQGGKFYESSEAVLKIASHLSYPWKVMVVSRIIPAVIRDYIYQQVARNRHRLSSRKLSCTPEIAGTKHRFL